MNHHRRPLYQRHHPATYGKLIEILRLIAEGRTNADIAHKLGISFNTLKSRNVALFDWLGARDRAHAVAIGFQKGYLGPACIECKIKATELAKQEVQGVR